MKSAARRQREHVERLSQPISRRKTVYVQPYQNCGDSGEYLTIGIPQDMTQLHQVLDKIHEAVGYKLITPVVGLYRYRDQTRVHTVREIQNNERLIYVCQGEVQTNNTSYYTSSQSSENSQQQWQKGSLPLVVRQNSGSTSSSPGYLRYPQRSDTSTWHRQKSFELDIDNSLVVPQVVVPEKEVRFQKQAPFYTPQNSARPYKSARVPPVTQHSLQHQQRQEGGVLMQQLSNESFNARNLKPFKTMPRHVEQEEQLEYNTTQSVTTQSVVSGQVSIASGIPPRRAISFQHHKSMTDYTDFLTPPEDPPPQPDLAPRRMASEPHRRRGKSQTEVPAISSDNFSFDVQFNEGEGGEGEDLSSTPTYGSSGQSLSQRVKAESLNSSSQKSRGEGMIGSRSFNDSSGYKDGMQEDFDVMTSAYRSNDPKFMEGSDFDAINSSFEIDEQEDMQYDQDLIDELQFSDRSIGLSREIPKIRLSPILEPGESPRLMPVIPESQLGSARTPKKLDLINVRNNDLYAMKHPQSARVRFV